MNDEKKIELLADTFECDVTDLSPEVVLDDLVCWDSMAKLSLIVLMDDEFGKTLTSDAIKEFKTVADILNYMN